MKILQVIHQDPRNTLGGSETYCRHLTSALAKSGNEVAVFFAHRDDKSPDLEDFQENGIRFFRVNLKALSTDSDRFQYTNSYDNREVLAQFIKTLGRFRPNVVHVHHLLTLSVDIISTCRQSGIPVFATLHDFWYFCHRINLTQPDGSICDGPGSGTACKGCGKEAYNRFPGVMLQPAQALASVVRKNRLIRALHSCQMVYAPCHSLMHRYEQNGLNTALLHHRPYGIPDPQKRIAPKERPPVFGFIGNISPHKGLDVLLKAANQLPAAGWKMLIHGAGDPDYVKSMEELAKQRPVFFTGGFGPDQLEAILDAIDILIVPSTWEENSPLVVHEAYAYGIPVIASSVGGLSEIVSELRGGALFPPGDDEQLSFLLRNILDNPWKIKKMKNRVKMIRTIETDAKLIMSDYRAFLEAGSTKQHARV